MTISIQTAGANWRNESSDRWARWLAANLATWKVAANGECNAGQNYPANLLCVLDANGFGAYSARPAGI